MTIEKQGLPNEFTQGEVGDIYIDTDTGFKFECTSKISIKAGKDNDVKYIWMPVRENYKQMVDDASTALSEKLQTEVDKNNLVDEIGNIDVGAIVQGIIKDCGIMLKDVVDTASSVSDNRYNNNISINAIDYVNATSVGNNAMTNCISLKSVNMPVIASVGGYAMANCISLTNVNMPSATSVGSRTMQNCILLKSVNMPVIASVGGYAMQNCISLTNVNMPVVTSVGTYAMQNCISLKSVRLGANQVCTLTNANAFAGTPIARGTGYIYVPDELVDSYKTATNWSVYADQIRPMSEYVEEVNE